MCAMKLLASSFSWGIKEMAHYALVVSTKKGLVGHIAMSRHDAWKLARKFSKQKNVSLVTVTYVSEVHDSVWRKGRRS